MINAIDKALQSVTPTIMVPAYEELAELTEPGHRILMAKNGVWLEVVVRGFTHAFSYPLPCLSPFLTE